MAAAFLGSFVAAAAAELNLTTQQRQDIAQSVQSERTQTAPAGFQPRIGAAVPQSMSLRPLPASVAAHVPVARDLQFAKLDTNEVLRIDRDRRVADIIMTSGTTGAAPAQKSPTSAIPQ
jgi:hypothetical protein